MTTQTFQVVQRDFDFAVVDTRDGSVITTSPSCGRARAEADRENGSVVAMSGDVSVRNEGTIVTFAPLTTAGEEWLDENIPHATRFGPFYVAEHRFAGDIIEGIEADGLAVAA